RGRGDRRARAQRSARLPVADSRTVVLRASARYGAGSVLAGVELELLDLPRERVAAPAQPLRGFHAMAGGMRERAQDEGALEFLFQPVADRAFAARERLSEFAIESLLPVALFLRGGASHAELRRQVRSLDALARTHHRHPVAYVFELTDVAGKRKP